MHDVIFLHHMSPCVLHTRSHPHKHYDITKQNSQRWNISADSSSDKVVSKKPQKAQTTNKQKHNIQTGLLHFCCPSTYTDFRRQILHQKCAKSTSTACHTEFLKNMNHKNSKQCYNTIRHQKLYKK